MMENKLPSPESVSTRGDLVLKKVVNCGRVNVRSEPNATSQVLSTLPCGQTILSSPDPIGDYYKVRLAAKEYGYILKKYLA